jgi:outer membrane protein
MQVATADNRHAGLRRAARLPLVRLPLVRLAAAMVLAVVTAEPARGEPLKQTPVADGLAGLRGAMATGYRENPSVEAVRAGQKALDEGVAQAIAALRPTVTATASSGYTAEIRRTPDLEDRRRPESAGVKASLLLFDGMASVNAVRAAEARARAGQAGLDDSEQRLLAEIAVAHANVWRDRQIASLEAQNVRFLAEQLESVRRRIRIGDLSRTDLAQADTRYNEARANLSAARAELAASEATYMELVGEPAGKLALPEVPAGLFPPSLDAAMREAAKRNPLIRKAEEDLKAADRDIGVRAGAFFPKVTVDTSYDNSVHTSATYESSEEFAVHFRLNFPFYDGGARESLYRQARARSIEAAYRRAATRRGVASSVQTLWHRRAASGERMTAARRQLAAADLALKGVTVEVRVGERSFIDVLDAQRERIGARIALARARADHVGSSFQLAAALGRCTPEALGLPVEPYDSGARLASIKRSWLGLFVQ